MSDSFRNDAGNPAPARLDALGRQRMALDAFNQELAGERPNLGDGVLAIIDGQTPYVTLLDNTTTLLKRKTSSAGKVGDTVLGLWLVPTGANASATLKDGTGLNGVFSENILPAGSAVGTPVWVPMRCLPSQDGGWSVVQVNCRGYGLGNFG